MKHHSHRIISNRKLPGAAVWHGPKSGTQQHKVQAHLKQVCLRMRVCMDTARTCGCRSAPEATSSPLCPAQNASALLQHYSFKIKQWLYLPLSPLLHLLLSPFFPFSYRQAELGPQLKSKLQHTQLEGEKGCKTKSPLQQRDEQLRTEPAIADLANIKKNILMCL